MFREIAYLRSSHVDQFIQTLTPPGRWHEENKLNRIHTIVFP